jgi:hypothetical protein
VATFIADKGDCRMTIAHKPPLAQIMEDIDVIANRQQQDVAGFKHAAPAGNIMPPIYGEKYRSAITSCVEALSTDLCGRVKVLKQKIDVIEQRLLKSAEASMNTLHEHVAVATHLHDQISGLEDVIAGLEERTRDGA